MNHGLNVFELVETAIDNGLSNHGALGVGPLLHCVYQRKRGFAFGEVIAQIFAQFVGRRIKVQRIVHQLKSLTEMLPEGDHC